MTTSIPSGEVEKLIRAVHDRARERGFDFPRAKVSKLVRRFLRAGGTAASWSHELPERERIVLADIDAIARQQRISIRVINAGLPSLGKRR